MFNQISHRACCFTSNNHQFHALTCTKFWTFLQFHWDTCLFTDDIWQLWFDYSGFVIDIIYFLSCCKLDLCKWCYCCDCWVYQSFSLKSQSLSIEGILCPLTLTDPQIGSEINGSWLVTISMTKTSFTFYKF